MTRRRELVAIRPDQLRAARVERGLSQAQLAAGIATKQSVHFWESGQVRPRRDHLEAIVNRLGIPLHQVLADPRDPREGELTRLEAERRLGELRTLADQVLEDRNSSLRTQAAARYHRARATLQEAPAAARAELRRARRQLLRVGLPELAAEAADWEAMALYHLQDPGAAAAAGKALAGYRRLPLRQPAVEARMLEHLGACQLQAGENRAAVASYRQALAGTLDLSRLALIYHGLAIGCRRLGDVRDGLEYMSRAVGLLRTWDEIRGHVSCDRARAESTFADHLLRVGDWSRAEEMAEAALQHFAIADCDEGRAVAMITMGEVRQRQDELDEALSWIERGIQLAERLGATVAISEGYQALGQLFAALGQAERCEAAFSRAVEVLVELPERRKEVINRWRQLVTPDIVESPADGAVE